MRPTVIGFDGQRERADGVLNASVGQGLVLLEEPGRADHVTVDNNGKLSRRMLYHEKALLHLR